VEPCHDGDELVTTNRATNRGAVNFGASPAAARLSRPATFGLARLLRRSLPCARSASAIFSASSRSLHVGHTVVYSLASRSHPRRMSSSDIVRPQSRAGHVSRVVSMRSSVKCMPMRP
jgi:hypothetical protein